MPARNGKRLSTLGGPAHTRHTDGDMNNTSKPAQPDRRRTRRRARHRARRLTTVRPVPLMVWTGHATKPRGRPGTPPAVTAAPCSRHLPPWLASRIVTEFSHPGDVIVVPDS